MQRTIATPPESVDELCLIRLGLIARRWTALSYARTLGKAIDRAAREAITSGAGLLHAERFLIAWNHFGLLQYWRSYDDLDAWSHRTPHADWWREALARMRTKGDFGIYHETFLVPRNSIEAIYLDCPPIGLSAFGPTGQPVGPQTTSRQRLGRSRSDEAASSAGEPRG